MSNSHRKNFLYFSDLLTIMQLSDALLEGREIWYTPADEIKLEQANLS